MKRCFDKGQMIRFTWFSTAGGEAAQVLLGPDDYLWGLAEDGNYFEVIWCHPDVAERMELDWTEPSGWLADMQDRFVIIPEDEWPDEVCVAMAKRALC